MTTSSTSLDSGIAIIHSNQLEELRDVVEYWLRTHPLAPLENEFFLVQSNGMGQWLKQSLAQNSALGVAAAITMQLPALFIWRVYQAVLGDSIPKEQLLAKSPLLWRLYRLMPQLTALPEFATLARFLEDDSDCRKSYQLCEQLADLYDQYQVYRADWIAAWGDGQLSFANAHGIIEPLPTGQTWQAALWQAVLADIGGQSAQFASRAAVHSQFMQAVDSLEQRPAGIPRRIIVFGLSSLPQQSLEVLAKLGRFCQIVLFVHNPCQHYWADIIEDKDLLKAERRRQRYKSGMTDSIPDSDLHLHAPPLLAAWGKQGRDYIRLLDHFDEARHYANWHWPDNKIDLFKDYGSAGQRSLLQQLQQSILDLEPLPETPWLLAEADSSIRFHKAHSPQRELEILHDQLLAYFAAAQERGDPLYARDVIVMVPDINLYAPHIRAVFGLIQADDPRYIPYSLADQQQRGQNPLLLALEAILDAPNARFTVSEVLGLLEVPALRARFGLEAKMLPKLHQWLEESGIRWGLNAGQRQQTVAMPAGCEANTWQFGLRRMLLGYAVGAGLAFNGIEPYEEMGGLEAKWLGGLALLLETLENYVVLLSHERAVADWQATLMQLLADFFVASTDSEQKTLDTLETALAAWLHDSQLADLSPSDVLPIGIVREAWLTAVDEPSLQQRFLSGRVNFCTLMPMRAIPFRLICLLGMNDGDYPRNQPVRSFDLMGLSGHYRPGDRSRRQDDHYLFLEALLSARQQLYISWVGRSIRDNTERPPSVLVSQLREVIAHGWCLANAVPLLPALTVEHPLQPFSPAYIAKHRDPRLFTYAREWFENSAGASLAGLVAQVADDKTVVVALEALARFLKSPVKTFCNQTLKFAFDEDDVTSEDAEPFAFDNLQAYLLCNQLLAGLVSTQPDSVDDFFQQRYQTMAAKGQLPLAGFGKASYGALSQPVKESWGYFQEILPEWPQALEPVVLDLPAFTVADGGTVQLTGELGQLRLHCNQQDRALLYLTAQTLASKDHFKYHNLLFYWVQHLAACASQLAVQTLVVAADTIIELPPIEPTLASQYLQAMVEAYYQGLRQPLPLASKAGFAWLATNQAERAQAVYEGDDWHKGEVAYDAYLGRFFPSFASLTETNPDYGFEYWSEALYQPLFASARHYGMEEQ